MKKFLLLTLFSVATTWAFAQTNEDDLVRASFSAYKSAILNDKGEEAVKYVDSRTIKYYDKILGLVKTADSTTVDRLGLMDKIMVLTVRSKVTPQEVRSFDGSKLLVYAIKSGMVGKNSVSTISVGDVRVDGNFATGQFVNNSVKTPLNLQFYKEGGSWKSDLTALFPASAGSMKSMVERSGKTENEFILFVLETLTGKKQDATIWKPFN